MRFLVIGAEPNAERRARILVDHGHVVDCADVNVPNGGHWYRSHFSLARPARPIFEWTETADPGGYDAALICTPLHARVQVALACLRVGIRGLFIEAPVARHLEGLDELLDLGRGHPILIGCALRFAFSLPRFPWSLLEVIGSRPNSTPRVGAQFMRGRGLTPEIAYPELDLAYSVNGPVYRLDCVTTQSMVCMRIEHESAAHSEIRVDGRALYGDRRLAILSAWDDGTQVHVPHKPHHVKGLPDDDALADELNHFLDCLLGREAPCKTLTDAAYLLGLTVRAAARETTTS